MNLCNIFFKKNSRFFKYKFALKIFYVELKHFVQMNVKLNDLFGTMISYNVLTQKFQKILKI